MARLLSQSAIVIVRRNVVNDSIAVLVLAEVAVPSWTQIRVACPVGSFQASLTLTRCFQSSSLTQLHRHRRHLFCSRARCVNEFSIRWAVHGIGFCISNRGRHRRQCQSLGVPLRCVSLRRCRKRSSNPCAEAAGAKVAPINKANRNGTVDFIGKPRRMD